MVTTYTLTNDSKSSMSKCFLELKSNPYKNYIQFHKEVKSMIDSNFRVFSEAKKYLNEIWEQRKTKISYAHVIKNLPVDIDVPLFDRTNSVEDKYRLKNSFIGEAVLEMAAIFTATPILAYDTRTNGDFFHDVYPIDKYQNTQTQKTDGDLYFHNDRTAHPIRADYLYLLGMTPNVVNNIYTGYIDGRNILELLTIHECELLRDKYFYTPYDEYSRDSNINQIDSGNHAILIDEHSFRYYDTRTTVIPGAPIEYLRSLLSLKNAIIKATKRYVKITKGDLFLFANLHGLHCKQLIEISDIDEAKHRWLLKTYNFRDHDRLNEFSKYYDKDIPGLVKDSLVTPQ